MKKIFLLLIVVFQFACSNSNEDKLININPDKNGDPWLVSTDDSGMDAQKEFVSSLPSISKVSKFNIDNSIVLPDKIDNSSQKYFRPIFSQVNGSCTQAAGVGYLYTYEVNRLRNLDSSIEANLYPTHFTYNFLNLGNANGGASSNGGWDIIRVLGVPDLETYGGSINALSYDGWMSGYDKYYSAMKNRLISYYKIPAISTTSGLKLMKQWLANHADGAEAGGIVNCTVLITGVKMDVLPEGTPEAGKKIITKWSTTGGHSMTFVGYDDTVRYDFNNDGQYTNDVDINNDGVVNMKDWEIGAMIIVNSWGTGWADGGKAYMMYKLLADSSSDGGIWGKDVMVIDAIKEYNPKITAKIKLKHSARGKIKIMMGVANDINASSPEYINNYAPFYYNGGNFPMKGASDNDPIEIGLDITQLMRSVTSKSNVKFFLQVNEHRDDDNEYDGEVVSFSVLDYSGAEVSETVSADSNVAIVNNGTTTLSLVKSLNLIPPYSITAVESKNTISLSWSYPENEADYFKVLRDGELIDTSTSNSYTDINIKEGYEYHYSLVAVKDGNESAGSSPVSATAEIVNLFPYTEGFENCLSPTGGWIAGSSEGMMEFYVGSPASWSPGSLSSQGANDKFCLMYPNIYKDSEIFVTSPLFDFSGQTGVPVLKYDFEEPHCSESKATGYCEISEDFGKTWEVLYEKVTDGFIVGRTWETKTLSLAKYANKKIKLRWRYVLDLYEWYSNSSQGGLNNVNIYFEESAPEISLSTYSIDFGKVKTGNSKSSVLVITNSGNEPLTGTITMPKGYYVTDTLTTLDYQVEAGDSLNLTISFKPSEIKEYNNKINITSNDSDEPLSEVSVYGEGSDELAKTYDQVYLRGTCNSWVAGETSKMELVSDYTWVKKVTFGSTSEERFKFDIYGDWTVNFGDSNSDGYADQSGADIFVDANTAYIVTFNDSTKKYSIVKDGDEGFKYTYSQVYLRGTCNSWVADETSKMKLVSDYTWEKKVTFGSTSEERFKFDINGDWTVNFGDSNSDGYADQSGADIFVDANTTYTITFNDSTKKYSIVKDGDETFKYTYSQVYLRGTCNSWVADENSKMELIADYTWEKKVTFSSTSEERFKFDIYGDWSLNFGDTNSDFTADQTGSDIFVEANKTYTVQFNDQSKVYSLVAE